MRLSLWIYQYLVNGVYTVREQCDQIYCITNKSMDNCGFVIDWSIITSYKQLRLNLCCGSMEKQWYCPGNECYRECNPAELIE